MGDCINRINKVIDYYCISLSEFARKSGIDVSNLNKMLKGQQTITKQTLKKIADANNVSFDWLSRGDGSMLNVTQNETKNDTLPVKSYSVGVPYYNVDFIGGFDVIINDQTINPEYYIDFKQYNSADCWCNVTGHSMEPEINQGDIIALKELHDWRTYIPAGEIYGLVTTEHRTIKKVCPSPKEGFLRLIPTNKSPEYVPQDIPISIVLRVYKVLGCMKRL